MFFQKQTKVTSRRTKWEEQIKAPHYGLENSFTWLTTPSNTNWIVNFIYHSIPRSILLKKRWLLSVLLLTFFNPHATLSLYAVHHFSFYCLVKIQLCLLLGEQKNCKKNIGGTETVLNPQKEKSMKTVLATRKGEKNSAIVRGWGTSMTTLSTICGKTENFSKDNLDG